MSYIEVSNPSVRRAMLLAKHVDHPKPPPIKIEIVDINEQEISALKAQLEAARTKAAEIDTQEPQPLSVTAIVQCVSRYYNVSYADIVSPRRQARTVFVRHVAMYLAKKITARSFPQIARLIGDRDHTTSLHAFRKIEARRTVDSQLAADLEQLEKELTQ